MTMKAAVALLLPITAVILFKYHPDIITPDDLFKGRVKHLANQQLKALSDKKR